MGPRSAVDREFVYIDFVFALRVLGFAAHLTKSVLLAPLAFSPAALSAAASEDRTTSTGETREVHVLRRAVEHVQAAGAHLAPRFAHLLPRCALLAPRCAELAPRCANVAPR